MKVTAVAYPTIPVVFVSSAYPNRVPLHNSMGLAITDLRGEVRTETVVEAKEGSGNVEFFFDGKQLEPDKLDDTRKIMCIFEDKSGKKFDLKIDSRNHNIYSGSSDAGAAALVVALQEIYGTNFNRDQLAEISMILSESSIRAMYGGLNEINVDGYPHFYGRMIASEKDLKDLRIFGLTFDYESRVSAAQIFQATRANPFYQARLDMIPTWIGEIKLGLLTNNWDKTFMAAEQNCANAHYLIETSGLRCRKKEMMEACIAVEEIRDKGISCYWTAGGGRVINVFSWGDDAEKVRKELESRGFKYIEYRVASGASIVK